MKVVGRLKAILGLDKSGYDRGLKGAEKSTSQFSSGIKKLGGIIAGAFAVSTIINFAKESARLSGEAEGIRQAYSKINNTNIDSLRRSVQGTVSDMELMRSTVEAATLGLDASRMPELFAFAAQRAKETGQEVDYLVDSIVKGIGRKSPLILDNLGISAIALKEKMGGVSLAAASVEQVTAAVAEIAREATGSLDELGDAALTAGQKTQQLEAETQNLKVAFGDLINSILSELTPAITKFTSQATKELNSLTKVVSSDQVSGWQKFVAVMGIASGQMSQVTAVADILEKEEQKLAEQTSVLSDEITTQSEKTKAVVKNVGWYKEEISRLKKSIDDLLPSQTSEIAKVNDTIWAYESLIKRLDEVSNIRDNMDIAKIKPIDIESVNMGDAVTGKLADVTGSFTEQIVATTDLWGNYMNGFYDEMFIKASETFGSIGQLTQGLSDLYRAQKESEIAAVEAKAKAEGKSEAWISKKKDEINKKYAKKEKKLAIAMAIINTAQGVTKALASGGLVGILMGALVLAAGAIQISKIKSQGMEKGGIVPSGFPNDTYPAALTSGEMVVPPNKLPSMMGGGQKEELITRIEARHLDVILKRWSKDRNRIT